MKNNLAAKRSKKPKPYKHYTATVFLVTKEKPKKVLLIHHKKMDKWMPPGGHQETDENAYQTALREVREETGIEIRDYLPEPTRMDERAVSLPLPRYIFEEKIEVRDEQPEHFHLDFIYVVTVPYQKLKNNQFESHSIGWFSKKGVKKLSMLDNVAFLIEEFLS